MRSTTIGLMLIGTLAAGGAAAQTAPAQTAPAQAPRTTVPEVVAPPAAQAPANAPNRTDAPSSPIVDAGMLEAGANSFTEGQARSRFEDAGFTGLTGLMKDDAGFWRGRGTRGGTTADVAMDFRGRIATGPGVARLSTRASGTPTTIPPSASTPATPAPAPATPTSPTR